MKLLSLLLSFFVLLPSIAQSVDITVDGVQRYFVYGDKPFQTLKVTNQHKDKAFSLAMKVEQYINLDEGGLDRKVIEGRDGHFMLAPKVFTLQPGQSRDVRLVSTMPFGEKERVYRVVLNPELQQDKRDESSATAMMMGAQVVSTAGLLVTVSPKDMDFKIDVERDFEGVRIKNTGNVTFGMRRRLKLCEYLDGENVCMSLPAKKLRPGQEFFFEVRPDMPLRWVARAYDRFDKWLDIPAYDE